MSFHWEIIFIFNTLYTGITLNGAARVIDQVPYLILVGENTNYF